jgi:hypothetical protein
MPGEKIVRHGAETIDVGARVCFFAAHLLRRHIGRSSQDVPMLGDLLIQRLRIRFCVRLFRPRARVFVHTDDLRGTAHLHQSKIEQLDPVVLSAALTDADVTRLTVVLKMKYS